MANTSWVPCLMLQNEVQREVRSELGFTRHDPHLHAISFPHMTVKECYYYKEVDCKEYLSPRAARSWAMLSVGPHSMPSGTYLKYVLKSSFLVSWKKKQTYL